MIMTSTISTTDQSATSADSNERLLQQIENLDIQSSSQNNNSHNGGGGTTTSVATADLLDMLEQEVTSRHRTNNDTTIIKSGRREYSSGDDITNNSNNNRRRPAQRRYSGSSIEGSFTSKLLGGYTDLEELDNNSDDDDYGNNNYNNNNEGESERADTHHVTAEEEEEEFFIPSIIDDSAIKKSTISTTNYAALTNNNYASSLQSTNSSSGGKSSLPSSDNSYPQTTIYATPTKTQDGSSGNGSRLNSSNNNSREQLYHSSDNSSKAHHNMAPLASRPSFDNPFRSSTTNSKTSSASINNNYDYGADISGSDSMGKHNTKHKRNSSAAGNKHKREGYGSGNSRTPKRSTNRPRPEMRGQHSVSFSIEEDQEADLSSEYMSTSHMTRTTQSSDQDTFSLGSLALSAGNSSRGSHTSRASSYTSRSSKSSRSSRSSHGSATTASTHSSGNSTERRRRRELLPVKQDRSSSKKRSQTGGGGSISSMSGSSVSGGLGSAFSGSAFSTSSPVAVGMKPQKFHTHHSRRRKKASSHQTATSNSIPDDASSDGSTSSRNLYTNRRGTTSRSNRSHGSSHHSTNSNNSSNNIKGDGEEALHSNLHDHHPIHYPKRSGLYRFGDIEEGNEDDETGGMKNVDSHSDIMNGLIDTNANSEGGEDGKTDDVSSLGNSSLGRPTVNVVRKDSKGSSVGKRGGGGDGRGKYEGVVDNSSTDEDGLFRRVDKVRNEMLSKPSSSDSFLNGLIGNKKRGSSPKKNAYNQPTDDTSEEEKSFLSNLLAKNNAARKRKGGSVRSGDASGHSESSNLSEDTISQINIYQKRHNERRASLDRGANMIRQGYTKVITSISRCYHDGGELLPNNQKEWIVLLVCTFLLMPLVHVAVIHAMGDGVGSTVDFYGDQIQFTGSLVQDDQHSSLHYAGESEMAWAGSSQVMLSESSSLHENFILMPDTDWIELQISRSKAAAKKSNGGGGLNNFLFHKNDGNIKPPKRLPLPSIIDPVYNSSAAVVLYSLTASNSKKGAHSGMNEAANSDLWNAIQEQLAPPPIDAWPSWSHNSLAQFREDGFTLMYPYNQRQRARKIIKKLAKEFGQSVIYEYGTWSEMSPPADIGDAASARGSGGFGGGTKHVGKDGYSSIVIPPMSNGRSDVMIRRTLSIRERWEEGDEPVVVMRRVKDLPVEDELTMREFEGPSLEEIVWD